MAVDRRQLVLGAGAVATLAAVVMWQYSSGQPASAPPTAARPARPAATVAATELGPVDVDLEALTRSRPSPEDTGRNPFRFRPRPAPTPPPPVARNGGMTLPPTTIEAPVPTTPPGPPPPPAIALKFIGLVQRADGVRIAVLSDGKQPISGKEGDEVDGRYRLLRIGPESLEISYLDGRGRRTIPLSGQ